MPSLPGRTNPNEPYERLKKLAKESRRWNDREAWLNLSFYLNEQYVDYVTLRDGTGRLTEQPDAGAALPSDQRLPRPTINKIMHFSQQELAFSMKNRPVPDILPAGDDPLDLSDADVANAYVRWLEEPNVANFEDTLWNANLWAIVCNEAYIKWVYSTALNRPDIQFCPSTDIYADPYARDFYKCRWVIHEQFLDPEQVYDVYGVEVKPNQVEQADPMRTEMLRELGQAPVMQGVTVNELWMLPCRRYPKGLFRVWAGREVLVENRPFPYAHGGRPQLPFTVHGVIPRPNSKHYASPVTFLRAPQVELNRYHAQRLMTRQAWALLKLWLPEGIELEQPWDNSPNQVLKGSSADGTIPTIIGPNGPLPDNNDGEWLVDEMENVVGLHAISQGEVPGRVEAFKAIDALRESDLDRLAVLSKTNSIGISKGFWQALMLARQYNDQEIVIEAYSNEGVAEVKRFFSSQFKPGQRIRVSVGNGLSHTRAGRIEQLSTLWRDGILRDPETFAQLADIPIPQIMTNKAYDVRLARNENLVLASGKAITANSWDDHAIHIREHNNYRKTSEFAAATPEVKARYEHHVSEHEDLELEVLKKDAEKAMLLAQATGQAPPPGTEVPPAAPLAGASPAEAIAAEA